MSSVGPWVDIPVVVVVEVPVVWEILPGWGLVAVVAGTAGLVGLVGLGLIFQDLRDEAAVGFGGDDVTAVTLDCNVKSFMCRP